jgi:transcriptional regulator with XRE-family HTH domain
MTEQQLADAVGCHSVTLIYDWESGVAAPDGRLRGKLAEALGVTPRWLHLGGEPPA